MSVTEKVIGNESMEKLLADLARMDGAGPDGFTAAELSARLNLGIKSTRDRISRGIAAGLIEFAGHRVVSRIDGQNARAPVYRAKRKLSPRK